MFETDDIELLYEKLKNKGVKTIGEIRTEPYGKLLTFEDPRRALVMAFCYFYTVKSNEVFFIGVSLLLSLSAPSSRKKGAVGKSADRFTLFVFLEWLSIPSLHWGEWRKPNSPPHRAEYYECFHPLPIHNFSELSAVLLPCFRQRLQTLPRKHTASVLCKLSSSYSQNSTFNSLCPIGSPLDNLRWVSQK